MRTAVEQLFNIWLNREYITEDEWLGAIEMEKEQQQGYSEQEMLEFSEWVSHNDWVYLPSKSYWVNEEQEELEENFTTKELFEQFKQQEQ
jgi:hypothetical protein